MSVCIGWGGGASARVESQKFLINKVVFRYRLEICGEVSYLGLSGKCKLLKTKGKPTQNTPSRTYHVRGASILVGRRKTIQFRCYGVVWPL